MEIHITPEQIDEVREMLIRKRNKYQPKYKRRNTNSLTDEYIINYIKNYVEKRNVRRTKYCNVVAQHNDNNVDSNSIYKIYKKFNNIEFNDTLKREIMTGIVSFN